MKKLHSRITAALTASLAAISMCHAFPASAASTVRILGDMDGDFQVTASDAQLTLGIYVDALVGNADNTANDENSSADVDGNGTIDVLDAQNILLYYCQTLVGKQPLWAEIREVSYHDGLDYMPLSAEYREDDPFYRVPYNQEFELTGMYIEIGCAQGAPGETVTVPVYIAGAPNLGGFIMFIDPPEGLEPVSVTTTMVEDFQLEPETIIVDGEEKEITKYILASYLPKGSFGVSLLNEIHPQNGYILASYSYKIPEDAQSGTAYSVCLNAPKTDFSDGHYKHYQYTALNGAIVVK